MKIRIVWLLIALITILGACAQENIQYQTTQTSDIEAEATVETEEVSGTLSFYTSQPNADAEALVNGFNEKYKEVDVELFRSDAEEVISRVLAEEEGESAEADVILVDDAVTFEGLKERNLLQSYESPQLDGISDEFIDVDHMYTGTKIMSTIIAVNTNMVEEMPTSWKVLNSEGASNQVIMQSPLYSGTAAYNTGILSRTEDLGWKFYTELQENEATVVQGNRSVLQSVAVGEKAYGIVVDFIVAKAKSEGSPVELVYPDEGVPVITEPVGILKNARNVPAAEAFVDFILSEEGQELSINAGYTPIREDLTSPEGLVGGSELNILSSDLLDLLQTRDEDKSQFRKIFGNE